MTDREALPHARVRLAIFWILILTWPALRVIGHLWQPGDWYADAEIAAGRRIDVRVLPRDDAFAIPDIIRTATNLVPPEVKEVRIVDIVGLDQQADGGTHVSSTAQIGRIEVVKIENKGKGFRRLRIRIAD